MTRQTFKVATFHRAAFVLNCRATVQNMKTQIMANSEDTSETTDLRQFASPSFTISKRLLGITLLVLGIGSFVGILAIDILDVGRQGGIGPSQQAALVLCGIVALIGLTLIPLGDKPA